MVYSVVYSADAKVDLKSIWRFIASDNIEAADMILLKIEDHFQRICEFPEIGRIRRDIRADVRAFHEGHYVIYYRVDKQKSQIFILRILHSARDIELDLN